MKPFIHLFETPQNYYFYDVNRNENVRIEKELYDYLKKLMYDHDNFVMDDKIEREVSRLKEEGYLSDNRVKEIEHPATGMLDYYLKRKLGLLTIQLTQACNLRCSYCPYTSNDGSNRLHGNKKISMATIKKALLFLRDNSVDRDSVTIGFYGGEPLVEFGLIKETINYCKEIFQGKEVRYTITTNGTLISDEVLELFEKENFSIVISLDGPKAVNDKNRKFAGSDQSVFDKVVENMDYMYENYREIFDRISINMVIDPSQDFKKYISLFQDNPNLSKVNIMTAIVEDDYKEDKYMATEAFVNDYNYPKFLSYLHYFGEIDMSDHKLYRNMFFQSIHKMWRGLQKQTILATKSCPSGPCIPGYQRLMVDVDGRFFPCERVSENIDSNCIGRIENGFDMGRVEDVLNIARTVIKNCEDCFAFRHCRLCVKAHDCKVIDEDEIKDRCKNVRYDFHNELIGREIINEIIMD